MKNGERNCTASDRADSSRFGGTFVTAAQQATRGVCEHESSLASELVNTSQQIGGALGIALLGAATIALVGAGASFAVRPALDQ